MSSKLKQILRTGFVLGLSLLTLGTAQAASSPEILEIYDLVESAQFEEANRLLKPLLAADDKDALGVLGIMYLYGYGRERDKVFGVKLCQYSADAGMPMGQHCLGHAYSEGFPGVAANHVSASLWWARAVAQDDLESMTHLARNYLQGDGVEQDVEEGLILLEKASDGGEKYAALELGEIYGEGLFVEEDEEKKLQYWEKAITWGLDSFGVNFWVALRYLNEYADDDELRAKGVTYIQEAANEGYTRAKFRLAYLCLVGEHIERDLECAEQMYIEAKHDYWIANYGLVLTHIFMYFDELFDSGEIA